MVIYTVEYIMGYNVFDTVNPRFNATFGHSGKQSVALNRGIEYTHEMPVICLVIHASCGLLL